MAHRDCTLPEQETKRYTGPFVKPLTTACFKSRWGTWTICVSCAGLAISDILSFIHRAINQHHSHVASLGWRHDQRAPDDTSHEGSNHQNSRPKIRLLKSCLTVASLYLHFPFNHLSRFCTYLRRPFRLPALPPLVIYIPQTILSFVVEVVVMLASIFLPAFLASSALALPKPQSGSSDDSLNTEGDNSMLEFSSLTATPAGDSGFATSMTVTWNPASKLAFSFHL